MCYKRKALLCKGKNWNRKFLRKIHLYENNDYAYKWDTIFLASSPSLYKSSICIPKVKIHHCKAMKWSIMAMPWCIIALRHRCKTRWIKASIAFRHALARPHFEGKKRAWVWEYKASICSATTCKYKFTICKNICTYQKYQLKADRLVHSPDAGRFNAFASQKQSDCACKPPTQEEFTLATALRLLFINLQTIC